MPITSKHRRQILDSLKSARHKKRSRILPPAGEILPPQEDETNNEHATGGEQCVHDLGRMNAERSSCGALHWTDERLARTSITKPKKFGTCCRQGKVRLPLLQDPPLILRQLLEGNNARAKEFQMNIRQHNASNAFTSLGAKVDNSILQGNAPYCFRIHRELPFYQNQEEKLHMRNYIYMTQTLHCRLG